MLLDVYQSQNHAKLFTFFTIFSYEAFCTAASERAISVVCDTGRFVLTRWRRARWLQRNKVGKWFILKGNCKFFKSVVNSGYMNPPIRAIPSIRFGFVLVEIFDGIDIPHMMAPFFIFIYSFKILAEFSAFAGIWESGFMRLKIYC